MAELTLGEILRNVRKEKALTQRELAERMSVVTSTISNWENGWRQPSFSELKRLAEALGVPMSTFNYDVEQAKEVDPDLLINMQTVEFKPLAFKAAMFDNGLFYSGISLLIIGYFVRGIVSFVLILLACFLLFWGIGAYVLRWMKFETTKYKKMLVPSNHQVFYYNPSELTDSHKLRHLMIALAAITIFTVALFHSLTLFLFTRLNEPAIIIIVSLYGIAVILSSFQRYRSLRYSRIFENKIDYYGTSKDLKHRSLLITGILDILALVALVVFISLLPNGSPLPIMTAILTIIGGLNAVLSYALFNTYRRFVSESQLKALDENQRIYPLI